MARRRRHDEHPVPGGAFIVDAEVREDEDDLEEDGTPKVKHFGGRIVNADGETLKSFGPDEENPGHQYFLDERGNGPKSPPPLEGEADEEDEPHPARVAHARRKAASRRKDDGEE